MTPDGETAIRIPRATFASMVTDRLRDSIVNGTLAPGSQLSEVVLAHDFDVSRGPVREALQRLVQEGLLHGEPHRGVFVPVLTGEDVVDIYLAREALESAAVRHLIATHRSVQASRALDQQVSAMESAEAAGDWDAVSALDLEFHTALVASTGSNRLQRMFSTLISETRLCLGALTVTQARDVLVAEHRKISDGIREENTHEALTALQHHFEYALVTLTNPQDPDEPPSQTGAKDTP